MLSFRLTRSTSNTRPALTCGSFSLMVRILAPPSELKLSSKQPRGEVVWALLQGIFAKGATQGTD